ncbi:hypothetical protein BC832DRAFT_537423 [Gaertneriomyces semiglobifer]|nr:hypothetical protein BC832DRAFT_537423 [Gaertneriomyces semiglobifer]
MSLITKKILASTTTRPGWAIVSCRFLRSTPAQNPVSSSNHARNVGPNVNRPDTTVSAGQQQQSRNAGPQMDYYEGHVGDWFEDVVCRDEPEPLVEAMMDIKHWTSEPGHPGAMFEGIPTIREVKSTEMMLLLRREKAIDRRLPGNRGSDHK